MSKTTAIVVGTGGMARAHIRTMLRLGRTTKLVGFVEPDERSRDATRAIFAEHDRPCPPFHDTVKALVDAQGSADAAFVCSPHKYHLEHAQACLRAGMDVLLEKPMVMNVREAKALIRLRDATGRLVMVAFPGSLSPAVWKAKQLIRGGALGRVTAIAAFAHQNWQQGTVGTWRQDPAISGGGFLFDTGSHMVNTVVDLLGEDVARVCAFLDNRGSPVEIASAVNGVSRSGVMFGMVGAGDSMECSSEITVFGDKAVLKTGIWGERLALRRAGEPEFKPIPYARSDGPWAQFLNVRAGKLENPCPPEVGLRFAKLMDMIREAATSATPSATARTRSG